MSRNLTKEQKRYILEMAKEAFESGHPMDLRDDETLRIFKEEPLLKSVAKKAVEYYAELLGYGPTGFYEEFRDELDFDPGFVAEYASWDAYYDIDEEDDEEGEEDD